MFEPYWDSALRRASPSIFVSDDISVSRLSVLEKPEIVAIFEAQFNRPDRTVHGVLQVAVNTVQAICQAHEASPRAIHGCEAPTATDKSHAVLKPYTLDDPPALKSMSKALAKKVLDACERDYFA